MRFAFGVVSRALLSASVAVVLDKAISTELPRNVDTPNIGKIKKKREKTLVCTT